VELFLPAAPARQLVGDLDQLLGQVLDGGGAAHTLGTTPLAAAVEQELQVLLQLPSALDQLKDGCERHGYAPAR